MAVLTDKRSVTTAQFVNLTVNQYWNQSTESFSSELLTFSNHSSVFVYDNKTYTPLGKLLEVGNTVRELRATSSTVSVTISGIPDQSLIELTKSRIKAAPIQILRAFFDETGALITETGFQNPRGRFDGFVDNYSLVENWDAQNRISSNTLVLECSSMVSVLANKTSGRRTNPENLSRYFPGDRSFDRVPALENSNYNFGIVR